MPGIGWQATHNSRKSANPALIWHSIGRYLAQAGLRSAIASNRGS
ncbi:MAG TPA: hypothetical protein V6D16_23570 [Candidatus Obscuribacterales bacterium]